MKTTAERTPLNPVPERAAAVCAYRVPTTREGSVSKPTDATDVSAVVRDEGRILLIETAKALGLTIPPSLLLRADQVIE